MIDLDAVRESYECGDDLENKQLGELLDLVAALVDSHDQNLVLRARENELRRLAKNAMMALREGMSVTGSCCNYCKESFTALEGKTIDECSAAAQEHDMVCSKNPVVAKVRELRASLRQWKLNDDGSKIPIEECEP